MLAADQRRRLARWQPLDAKTGASSSPDAVDQINAGQRRAVNKNWFNRLVWKPALKAAAVPPARENGCHALRHYFASVLLYHGCDIKALSEYLGHHSAAFTLSVYAYLMPAADDRMRDAVSAAWPVPSDGPATAQSGAK